MFCLHSWILQSESKVSGMAVLEVGVPTGYIIEQHELHGYVRSRYVRNLKEARFEEGKVIFYFEYVRNINCDFLESCILFYNIDLFVVF